MLPNFLVIGAARCGTTTLYAYLQEHPDVFLPRTKRPEPHFFYRDREYAKGLDWYGERYFGDAGGRRAVGECSTSYIFGEEVPTRIRAVLPDIRLIAMLRDPTERAFSNYWHTRRHGLETLSFEEAIDRERERAADPRWEGVMPFAYVERGFYHKQLSRFLGVFPRRQVLVVVIEEFQRDPAAGLAEVFRFLDVDEAHRPARFDLIENRSVPEGATIEPRLRDRLRAVFQPDVERLQVLMGRRIEGWLT